MDTGEPVVALRRRDRRRRKILDGALVSLLKRGYSATTVNDIANEAGISRPLIYHSFQNKDAIFLEMFSDIFDGDIARIRRFAASDADERAKIHGIMAILYLDLWDKMALSAERKDLLAACAVLFPRIEKSYRLKVNAVIAPLVGGRERANLLLLSAKGLYYDTPSTPVFRRRLRQLVDVFVPR